MTRAGAANGIGRAVSGSASPKSVSITFASSPVIIVLYFCHYKHSTSRVLTGKIMLQLEDAYDSRQLERHERSRSLDL